MHVHVCVHFLCPQSSGSVITELTGVLAKQLLLGLCKVAPKSRRASKMDTSMNQSMNQNPNMVTMDRRALVRRSCLT